ncbi:MAG TPA: hypothetical protein PKV71_11215 [Calditrichia bacterium]|nr:hypothetical protein [Calditrichota bacterium]HQV32440.1 hypothetical protein [Calditrichia bacterium]
MAKIAKEEQSAQLFEFPLGKTNFLILGFGVLVLIAGYLFMGMADHPDDFISITLSPVLLTIAFCIIFPVGLMYRSSSDKGA